MQHLLRKNIVHMEENCNDGEMDLSQLNCCMRTVNHRVKIVTL